MRRRSAILELALLTVIVISVVVAAFTWLSSRWQRSWLLEEARQGLLLTSDVLHSSLRQAMMLNQRQEIAATVGQIARQTPINEIRLIEHRGRIGISTVPEDRGRLTMTTPACRMCHVAHAGATRPAIRAVAARTLIAGGRLRAFTPVPAERGCVNQQCHIGESQSGVLGIIEVSMPLDQVEGNLARSRAWLMGLSAGAIILGGALTWLIMVRRLRRPMSDLLAGIRWVAGGDLNFRIPEEYPDEFGELAQSFNAMSRQLSAMQQNLIQSERLISMGKLAAGVAHEINNPLTGILTYAEDLLDETPAGDRRRDDYAVIKREALRCRQIVRNLLDFARQEAPALRPVGPAQIIDRAVELLAPQAAFRNIHFEREIEPDLPEIPADAVQIEQVLINLMVNAQQAMPDGGRIVLGAHLSHAGSRVEFSVKDSGVGIPAGIRTRIFEPFFSTKGGKTDGLGLAVCLGIVQRHQGAIDFESEAGQGAVFRVSLPIAGTGKPGIPPGSSHA